MRRTDFTRRVLYVVLGLGTLGVLAAVVWQGITAGGNPDPMAVNLSTGAVVLSAGLIVFREGLEAILVIAALTAGFVGSSQIYRRSIGMGAGIAFALSIATWFVVVALIDAVNAPALDVQAATGLLAIVVLLITMNWFFHKVYWTGWISAHNKRRRQLLTNPDGNRSRIMMGLALLGFTAVYREGFEVVLFLQNLRLSAGSSVVLEGVTIGLVFTAVVGVLTFMANQRLPYKKMLVFTGVMLAGVLVVMVGESAQALQLADWISTTPVDLPIPEWMGMWLATFPTLEGLTAQALAVLLVVGSYVISRYLNVWRPSKRSSASPSPQAVSREHNVA